MSIHEAIRWLSDKREEDIATLNKEFSLCAERFESLELSLSKALSRIKVLEKKNAEFEVFGNENDT